MFKQKGGLMRTRSLILALLLSISFLGLFAQAGDECATFDGYDDYISIGDNYKYTNGFTVEMWVYKANWSVSVTESLISCTHSGGYSLYFADDVTGDHLQFLYRNSADDGYLELNYPAALAAGWHHIAISHSSTEAKLYVDGEVISGAGSNITYDGDNHVLLGAEAGSSGSGVGGDPYYFTGSIDDVRIWDTVISAEQLSEWRHQPLEVTSRPANYTNLAAYWPFDSDLPNSPMDDQGNNVGDNPSENDCVLYNGTSLSLDKHTPIADFQDSYREAAQAIWAKQLTTIWSAASDGLSLKANSSALSTTEFYAYANNNMDGVTSADCTGPLVERAAQIWYLDGISIRSLDFKFTISEFAAAINDGTSDYTRYKLLRRDETSEEFTVVSTATSAGSIIEFENYTPTDGYYTIGREREWIYFVDETATGANDGTSWNNAFNSLQSALDASTSGWEIWVAKGTYKPSKEIDGTTDSPRDFTYQMINGVSVFGGFAGTETAVSERTDFRSGGANETILNGDIGTVDDSSDNCYHLFYHPTGTNLNSTAVLDGFTITYGNANGGIPYNRGAGIYNYASSPSINNCTFLENTSNQGSGIYNFSSSPSINNCTFSDNTASSNAGAIYNGSSSSPSITNCKISDNSSAFGAGIYNDNSSPSIINCIITGNSASQRGGGLGNTYGGTPEVINCTITGNSATKKGGGVYNQNDDTLPSFKNTIIWNNTAVESNNEIYNSTCTPAFFYCDIEASGGSINWDTDLGVNRGNNIDADPKFVGTNVNASHPYSLYGNSLCADAGDGYNVNFEDYDIRGVGFGRNLDKTDGNAGTIDIGAYEHKFGENPPYSPIIYVNHSATTGNNSGLTWEDAYTSFQSGLQGAVPGQEIWVAKGTYYPSLAYDLENSSRFYHFRLIDGVAIYGGFAGTETTTSARTDFGLGSVNETILSGDIGISDDVSDNSYHVFYHPDGSDITNTALLDGFTITKSNADAASVHHQGGGMYNGDSSPSIKNCTFSDNFSVGKGGGMFNYNSSPELTNCTFSTNRVNLYGAGMYNNNSSPQLANCTFTSNLSLISGGGMYNLSGIPILTNCKFTSNSADNGGAIYGYVSAIITNSLFDGNISIHTAGAMYNNGSSCAPVITNCTFTANSTRKGGGIYNSAGATPSLINTILWGNSASTEGNEVYNDTTGDPSIPIYSYCDIRNSGGSSAWNTDLGTDSGNNIDSDPLFVGSGDYPYLIYGNSPCTDLGDNSVNSETYDIRGSGFSRKVTKDTGAAGTIDMGAYEYKLGFDPEGDSELPVTLSSFTAICLAGNSELQWTTQSESNNLGWNIYRSQTGDVSNAMILNATLIPGAGVAIEPTDYSFTDEGELAVNATYYYWIEDITYDNIANLHGPVSITVSENDQDPNAPEIVLETTVLNYPNPFNPETQIYFSLKENETAKKIEIYNSKGQKICNFASPISPQLWNGKDNHGSDVSSGIYIYKLTTDKKSYTKKMVLSK